MIVLVLLVSPRLRFIIKINLAFVFVFVAVITRSF